MNTCQRIENVYARKNGCWRRGRVSYDSLQGRKFNRRYTYEFRFAATSANAGTVAESRKCGNALWRSLRSQISRGEFTAEPQTKA